MVPELEPVAPIDALAALAARGRRLDPTEHWTEKWQAEHAHAFTVARSAGFDILADIHQELTRALAEGATFRDFASELQPKLELKGWWGRTEDGVQLGSMRRLRTIFDANLRVSYAAGAWAAFERNKATRPWLRYVAVMDGRTRPEHARRHNLCLRVDDPYWDRWAPPCGWNCRCTLQSLSDRDVERMRGELAFAPPPDEGVRQYRIRATGDVVDVPIGIDPGWAHNPGKEGHRAVVLADKLVEAPPELAAQAAADPAWPARPLADEFETWATKVVDGDRVNRSTWTVGAMTPPILSGLKARGIAPASAAITVRQDAVRHMLRDFKASRGAAPPIAALLRLPETLGRASAVLLDRRSGKLLYVFDVEAEERLAKLVVEIDYVERASAPDVGRVTVVSNSIRSGGMVETRVLRDQNAYELIDGSLD
ncbi:phage minor head protein [Hansschlegelia zhihuaiae]|nr:phage minor head protein [Hansschlegelia zhihuaiae]